jgi:hypothetical protein
VAIPTMAADIGVMSENPEYQQMMQRVLNVPPVLRALANFSDVDAAAMKQLSEHNQVVSKLTDTKQEHAANIALAKKKLDLEQQKVDIDKTLGIGTSNAYYNLRTQNARDTLDLAKSKLTATNLIGAANVGVGLYGAYNQNQTADALLPIYLKRLRSI